MGERNNNILLWITDIYTVNLIFYCMVNVFVEKFQFHHHVDGIDLCILTGIGLFSYIGQNQFAARIGENGRTVMVIAGLLLAAMAIHGTQGYENFGTLLRYVGCGVLIGLAWQSTKIEEDEHLFVLKMEVMIGLVVLAAILAAAGKGPGISQAYFLLALLLNLLCVINVRIFRCHTAFFGSAGRDLKIKALAGLIYGSGLLACLLWLFLGHKAQSLCVTVGKQLTAWAKTLLFHMEQILLWIYGHLGTVRKDTAPLQVMEESHEQGGVDVTMGVVVILILAALVFTLVFVLLWEIFKKWRTAEKVRAQRPEKIVKEKRQSPRRSLALWVKERKARRTGPKKFLYKLAKLCKRTEYRMKASDTPKSFMDKVAKAYAPEGTALRQKMDDMAAEINRCYYAQAYSAENFCDREAARLLKEIKAAIKNKKKERKT